MGMVLNMSEPSIDLAIYGDRSGFLQNYLTQQIQNLGPSLNEFGQRMYGALQTSYNFVTDQLVQYGLRNELSQAGLNVLDNYYTELLDWHALQNANPTMQRWIMANPTVRELYQDQNIDGYSEQYKDVFGGGIGDSDYNYRRVTTGVIMDDSTDDTWTVKHHYEDLLPGDKELDHYEKCIILETWSATDWILDNCNFDFTAKSDEPTKINR